MIRPAQRRLLFLSAAFALSLLSCGREVTGPENGAFPGLGRVGALAIAPTMPPLVDAIAGAGSVVPFERVRIVLTRGDGGTAVDTLVNFPSSAQSVALSLLVPLPFNATTEGVPFALTMAYINAQGDTVFRAGPSTVLVLPIGAAGGTEPVDLTVTYTGVGANAAAVQIAPDTGLAVAGTSTLFSAVALDLQQQAIQGTPLLFYTLDSSRASLANPATGQVTWLANRGTARIVAALPSGARADTAVFTVTLPASQLVLASGGSQTGSVGAALAAPVVLRTLAADGVPVEGVEVQFTVAAGAGSISVATDTSDANGEVRTEWTLGPTPGPQGLTAVAPSITNGSVIISAIAEAGGATQLAITQQPVVGTAGIALSPALVVTARDDLGNTVPSYTGVVTVSLPPGADAQLEGTTSVNAVAGLATFDDLRIPLAGEWTLTVASDTLTTAVSAPITVNPGAATRLAFFQQPFEIVAGEVITPAVSVVALDALGNEATSISGNVVLSLTGAGVLGGTALRPFVAGVATFDDLTVTTAGTFSLIATTTGLDPDTSAAFSVSPGAAAALALIAGGGQSALAGSVLPQGIVVEVRDALGNAVVGESVTFSILSGGGSSSTTEALSDALGRVATTWTLGATLGDQILRAALTDAPTVTLDIVAEATQNPPSFVDQIVAPANGPAGAPLPAFSFGVYDQFSELVPTFTGPVTLSAQLTDGTPVDVIVAGAEIVAVGGVATFDAVVINTAGTYRFVADFGGDLGTYVTSAISIVAGSPTAMALVDGTPQADTVTRAFPAPLRVRVVDAFGNGVPAVAVTWELGAGSGAIDSTVALTDLAGVAAMTGTFGTVAEEMLVNAAVDGLAGSPLTFTLTAIPAAVASLAVVAQPDTVTAGSIAPPFEITAFDAFGNLVTWFTGDVQAGIVTSPDGGIINGAATQAAVGGTATFDDLEFTGTLGSWVLSFTSGGISINTAPFVVVAGSGANFSIVSGNNQLGPVTLPLPAPLVVRVTDAGGFPVAGDTVLFTVSQGGGTLSGGAVIDTVVTDAAGEASTIWTLGANIGDTQEVRAAYGALPELVFTALPQVLVANRTWSGAVSSEWANVLNWSEGLVPTLTDSVRIPAGRPNYPALAEDVFVARLTVDDGASATLGENVIYASGSVRVPQTLAFDVEGGGIAAVGAGAQTVSGAFPILLLQNGNYSTTGAVSTVQDFVIGTNARLDVATHPITVGGNLATIIGGRLQMVAGADVTVNGDAQFLGGSTDGLLVGGTLRVRGDFDVGGDPRAFTAGNFHTTIFDGSGTQTVSFSDPDTSYTFFSCSSQCFGRLEVLKSTSGIVFGSTAKALGGMRFTGAFVDADGFDLIATGNAEFEAETVEARRVGWQSTITRPANFLVDTLVAFGSGSPLPVSETIPTIVRGGHVLVGDFNSDLIIDDGSLEINVSGSVVTGNLSTRGSGRIRMIEATDSLIVLGNATFAGVTPTLQLTQGVLEVRGNFAQVGGEGVTTYHAEPTHRLRLSGTTQQVSVDDPQVNPIGTFIVADGTTAAFGFSSALFLGDVVLEGTTATATSSGAEVAVAGGLTDAVGGRWSGFTTRFLSDEPAIPTVIDGGVVFAATKTLNDSLVVTGELRTNTALGSLVLNGHRVRAGEFRTSEGSTLVMSQAADSLLVTGAAEFEGGPSNLTAGYLEVGGLFTQDGSGDSFVAGPAHITRLSGGEAAQVRFFNPGFGAGASRFGRLQLDKGELVAMFLASDVYVDGALETIAASRSFLNGPNRLTTRGAQVTDLTMQQLQWEILDGAPLSPLAGLRFEGQPATVEQLRIVRSGGAVTLDAPTFFTTPTTGRYLVAVDSVFNADPLTVTVVNPTPANSGGFAEARGEAVIDGWSEGSIVTWTGATSTAWTEPSNWSGGIVPDADAIAVVPAVATLPVIPAATTLRGLVVTATGAVSTLGALTVTDTLDLPDSRSSRLICPLGARLTIAATGTAGIGGGADCDLTITSGTATLFKTVQAFELTVNGSGVLDVGAFSVLVDSSLTTADAGVLRMTNVAGVVQVGTSAIFGGGSTAGQLTAGTLIVNRNLTQSGDPASFSAGAVHLTEIRGNADEFFGEANSISFANPATSGFASVRFVPGNFNAAALQTFAAVRGDLTIDPLYVVNGAGQDLIVDGDVTVGGSGGLNLRALRLGGTYAVAGTMNADTTEFRGSDQVIPSFPDGFSDGWNTVVVTGTARAAYPDDETLQVLGDVIVRGSGTLQVSAPGQFGRANVLGNLRTESGGRLAMQEANSQITVRGDAEFGGGFTNGLLTAGELLLYGNFTQLGGGPVFYASGAHTTRLLRDTSGDQVIFFSDPTSADPGRSAFGNLVIEQGSQFARVILESDITIQGQLIASPNDAAPDLTNNAPGNVMRAVFSYGASLTPTLGLTLNGTRWVIQDGAPITGSLRRLTFLNQIISFPQLEIARAGGTIALDSIAFDQTPNHVGPFLVARDESIDANPLTLQIQFPTPAFHGGRIQEIGEGQITGWLLDGQLIFTGQPGTDWNLISNWSPAMRPNAFTDVIIDGPGPTVVANGTARSLTIGSGGSVNLNLGATLNVFGDADIDGTVNRGDANSNIRLVGNSSTRFRSGPNYQPRLVIDKGDPGATVSLSENSTISSSAAFGVEVLNGRLNLDGRRLQINGSGFRTIERGQLEMRNSADELTVGGTIAFGGETTNELLTAGAIFAEGDFFQSAATSPTSFVSLGEHRVVFRQDSPAQVEFETSDPVTASRFNFIEQTKFANLVFSSPAGPVVVNRITNWTGGNLVVADDSELIITGTFSQIGNLEFGRVDLRNTGRISILGVNPDTCDGLSFFLVDLGMFDRVFPQTCIAP